MESNAVYLTPDQREELTFYTRKGYNSAMLIRRARCILLLDRSNKKDHLRIGRICDDLELSRQGLSDIRNDFFASSSIEEFLTRKKCKGARSMSNPGGDGKHRESAGGIKES